MVALLAAAFACYLLVEPYINSIVMAFIISLLMFPVHEWFERKIPKHPNMAALLSCVVLTFIIVIPLLFVFAAIVQQGSVFSQNTYNWVTNGGIQDIFQHPFVIKGLAIVNEYLPFDKIEPKAIAEKIGQFATSFGSNLVAISAKILGDATNFLMNFFLMLFVLFFLLRDHDKIISAIRHILPLSRSQEDRILTEIEQVSKSAVMGSFLTAIAQGLAGGYDGCAIIGNTVTTKPGNSIGPVAQGLNTRLNNFKGPMKDDGTYLPDKYVKEPDEPVEPGEEYTDDFYYSNYVQELASCASGGSCDGNNYLGDAGSNGRRILRIPIVDCTDAGGKTNYDVLGFGCFFLLQSVEQGGNASVFGQFLYDCMINNGSTGLDPDDAGLYRIQLYKDPFSGAS